MAGLERRADAAGKHIRHGFPVRDLIAYLSQCMSLDVGDVVATGTLLESDWDKAASFLKDQDELRLGITGLGEQRYRMIADNR